MRDNSERIRHVIKRADMLKKQREYRTIAGLKAACAVFACLLVCSIGIFSEHYTSATVTGNYGAILLVDGMGGYVLTAVAAFAAATVITVICMKKRK